MKQWPEHAYLQVMGDNMKLYSLRFSLSHCVGVATVVVDLEKLLWILLLENHLMLK